MSVSNDNLLSSRITRSVDGLWNMLNSFHKATMQVYTNSSAIPSGGFNPVTSVPVITATLDEGRYDVDFVVHITAMDVLNAKNTVKIAVIDTDADVIITQGDAITWSSIDEISTIYLHETIQHPGGNLNLGLGVGGSLNVQVAAGNFIVSIIKY